MSTNLFSVNDCRIISWQPYITNRPKLEVSSSMDPQFLVSHLNELPMDPLAINNSSSSGRAKIFQCPTCPKRFSAKSSVTQHIKYDCNRQPRFVCPYCDKRSKYPFSLYKHIRDVHPSCKVYCKDISGEKGNGQ